MRVTHVAGYRPMIDTIIEHQRARGLSPKEVSTRELNYTDSLSLDKLSEALRGESKNADILHLHDPSPILDISTATAFEKVNALLSSLSAEGAKLVLSVDGDVVAPADLKLQNLDRLCEILRENVACVFIGSAEWSDLISRLDNWSWLPNPVDVSKVPAPASYGPNQGVTRILHLAFSHSEEDSSRIVEKLRELCARDPRFVLTVSPVKDFASIGDLRKALSQHDVIVERISRPMYGWAALEGMAHGKTVLSGIHPQHRQEWQQLEFSPVLDSREENLIDRLLSLAQEPRSMRDIGKRSRSFVETYHSAEQIVAMMVEIYGQL